MTALTPDDLARIEELEKQASGAPWVVDFPQHSENGLVSTLDGDYAVADIFGLSFDAELIAALRNLAPALVAGVRSRDERIAELETLLDASNRQLEARRARITELETAAATTRQTALQDALAEIVKDAPPLNSELTLTPAGVVEDKVMAAYVEGMHDAWAAVNSLIITERAGDDHEQ